MIFWGFLTPSELKTSPIFNEKYITSQKYNNIKLLKQPKLSTEHKGQKRRVVLERTYEYVHCTMYIVHT